MTRYIAYCLAAITVLMTSCSTDKPRPETPPASEPRRIVTLGGAVTELTFALGCGKDIVGTDLSSVYPAETSALPKIGYWRSLAAEGILSLHPTMVLADYDAGPESVLQQIKDAGVPVHHLPHVLSMPEAQEQIRLIASALGKEQQGKELSDKLGKEYKEIQDSLRSVEPGIATIFIYVRGAKVFHVAGTNTAGDAMIRLAGGKNVAATLEGWKPVGAEFFLDTRPQVLIVTTTGLESIGGMEGLKALPGIQATPAVRDGLVLVVDDLAFLGFGPRMPQALRQMAEAYAKVGKHSNNTPGSK